MTKSQQIRQELAAAEARRKVEEHNLAGVGSHPVKPMSQTRYLHVSTRHTSDPKYGHNQTAKKDKRFEKPRGGIASTARRMRQSRNIGRTSGQRDDGLPEPERHD